MDTFYTLILELKIRGFITACTNCMLINEGEITNLNLEVFSQDITAATTNSET